MHVLGLRRTGKSCRLRWVNYLHPDLKRGRLNADEERRVIELHATWGNRWSRIAKCLPGRTDNEIKNYWRTHMRKKAQEQRTKLAAAAVAGTNGGACATNNTIGKSPGISYSGSSSTLSSCCSSNSIKCLPHLQPADKLVTLQVKDADAANQPGVCEEGGMDDGAGSWDSLQVYWEDAGWESPGISEISYQQQQSLQLGTRQEDRGSVNPNCWPPSEQQALVMPPPPSPLWEYSTHPIWKLLNDGEPDDLIFPWSCWN